MTKLTTTGMPFGEIPDPYGSAADNTYEMNLVKTALSGDPELIILVKGVCIQARASGMGIETTAAILAKVMESVEFTSKMGLNDHQIKTVLMQLVKEHMEAIV